MKPALSLSDVVALAPAHEVGAFSCGHAGIDDYLKTRARIEQGRGLNQCYVTADPDGQVLGYFTLSPISVRIHSALLTRLGLTDAAYAAIGGYLLGRLGVDRSIAGMGVGKALVVRAGQIARRQAAAAGGAFLAVDAKDERLVAWYATLGFIRLSADRRRMVLPFASIP